MQFGKHFRNNSVFAAAVTALCCVCISQAVLAEPIVEWGRQKFDSRDFENAQFQAIAAGAYHSLALKSDGSIVGWGDNDYGQATPPSGNDFVAIAAGGDHSLALKSDGSIVGWGHNHDGQATPPAGNDFVAIATGGDHSLALKSDGSIVGWGYNCYGQATPPAGNDFVTIAVGDYHSLALKSDGSIVGWGCNYDGEATPPAGNDFVAIAAGDYHSLALKSDGSIVGWGYNYYGQATPPAGNDFVTIAAGDYHSLALKSDGSIVGWGNNYCVQAPPAGNDFAAVAAGRGHSLALKSDGSIVGWGYNYYGQATPPAGNDFAAVAAGGWHSLALKSDGSIVGWGENYDGQATPPAGNDFAAVAAGGGHSLALKSDGSIVGWGCNYYGQATPTAGNDFVAIAAGWNHSLALKSDGSIVGWGRNDDGQATPPVGNDFVAIAAGWDHSLALKSDGSIVGWGDNDYGQATPPAGNDFAAVAAGGWHSLALKSDGSIVGWGYNHDGQATPPAGNDFVAIAAGAFHSLALKSDGSIVGWGDNYYGQATPPAGNDFVAIATGYNHSLALIKVGPDNYYFPPVPAHGKGIWIWRLGKDTPDVNSIIKKCHKKLVKWVAIKLGNGTNYWPDEGCEDYENQCGYSMDQWLADNGYADISKVFEQFHNANPAIKVFAWHYVYGDYPLEEAEVANRILDIPGIDGLVIDVEEEYEGQGKEDAAVSYMQAIRIEHPESFVACNTWGNPDAHSVPYAEFGFYCDAFMPQAYWIDWRLSGLCDTPTQAVAIMEQQWEELYEDLPAESIKPIIAMGQCTDGKGKNPCPGREIKEFCEAIEGNKCSNVSNDSVCIFRYGKMNDSYHHWDEYASCFNDALIVGSGPIDLLVTDGLGRRVGKILNEIPGANYFEYDIDGDGLINDIVAIAMKIVGTYLIEVTPEQNGLLSNYTQSLAVASDGSETYSLKLEIDDQTMVLAEDVPIEDIPAEPYVFESKLNRSDFDTDGDVDYVDLAKMSQHWLAQDCNYPDWCEGTDLNYDHYVNLKNFAIFADSWLWEKIPADLDIDGDVDFQDFAIFALAWLTEEGQAGYDSDCDIAIPYDKAINEKDLQVFTDNWLLGR